MEERTHMFNRYQYEKEIKQYPFEYYLENYYLNPAAAETAKAVKAAMFLNLDDKDAVLDLGCSLGSCSFKFSSDVKYVVGVDYELNSLLLARKYLKEYSKNKNVFFVQADALRLPFKEKIFSKLNNVDFIEHIIPANKGEVIREMKRVLKLGGVIFTYTPNLIRLRMEYYINKLKYALKGRYFGWQEDRPYKDKPELKNHQDTLLHVGLLSFYSLKRLFLKGGLTLKKIIYDNAEWSMPLLSRWIKEFPCCLRKQFFIYGIFAANSMMLFEKKDNY